MGYLGWRGRRQVQCNSQSDDPEQFRGKSFFFFFPSLISNHQRQEETSLPRGISWRGAFEVGGVCGATQPGVKRVLDLNPDIKEAVHGCHRSIDASYQPLVVGPRGLRGPRENVSVLLHSTIEPLKLKEGSSSYCLFLLKCK